MSFKGFSTFSSGGHFVQLRAIGLKDEMSFKGFSIFSSGSHFVQWSLTVLAILVEGHQRNISVTLF